MVEVVVVLTTDILSIKTFIAIARVQIFLRFDHLFGPYQFYSCKF